MLKIHRSLHVSGKFCAFCAFCVPPKTMTIEEKIHQFDTLKQGKVTCIYGESGSGKSYLAHHLRKERTIVLDGDSVRYYVNNDLGYSDEDRRENNRRIAAIALLLSRQGHDIIISTVRANIAYELLKDKVQEIELIKACYTS